MGENVPQSSGMLSPISKRNRDELFLERRLNMFEKGELIIYGNKGICAVSDITTLDMAGAAKDRLYYILMPQNQKDSKIFVPVDSNKTIMRKLISKEEAKQLIESIPEIQEIWVENDKLREEKYKECMRTCECKEWVRIIRTLYVRKQQRIAEGKKVTATDERYFRMAEESLYSELSIALDIPKSEMEKYIAEHIE